MTTYHVLWSRSRKMTRRNRQFVTELGRRPHFCSVMFGMLENKFLADPRSQTHNPHMFFTAVRPLLLAVPRPGDAQRPAAADVSRMRGMPLLRRRLQAGGAARSQARVPLPQAKGESVGRSVECSHFVTVSPSPLKSARISRTGGLLPH